MLPIVTPHPVQQKKQRREKSRRKFCFPILRSSSSLALRASLFANFHIHILPHPSRSSLAAFLGNCLEKWEPGHLVWHFFLPREGLALSYLVLHLPGVPAASKRGVCLALPWFGICLANFASRPCSASKRAALPTLTLTCPAPKANFAKCFLIL